MLITLKRKAEVYDTFTLGNGTVGKTWISCELNVKEKLGKTGKLYGLKRNIAYLSGFRSASSTRSWLLKVNMREW